jgi:glycine dehydrogenase subunit 1
MLAAVGATSIEDLFAAVPAEMRLAAPPEIGPGMDECSLTAWIRHMADRNRGARLICFAGGGYYDRYLPAAQRALLARGEFLTAYTPYQPEVSQGTLQATFEFQTMIAELVGLPVATAGLYDGSTALAEAMLLAHAATGRTTVVVAPGVHPEAVQVMATYARPRGLRLVESLPGGDGAAAGEDVAAVVAQQPDYYGRVHDLGALLARRPAGSLAIVAADLATLGVLAAPGSLGADVVAGEAQSVGLPLSYGGPYLGYMAATEALLRRLPGRICGESRDAQGRRAFVLTLQAREQHIRRARATSNVCTNQALCALAVTIYLSLLGPRGLQRLGQICLQKAHYLARALTRLPGVALAFPEAPFFAEFALRIADAPRLVEDVARRGYLVGPAVGSDMLLVAVTEKRTRADLDGLVAAVGDALAARGGTGRDGGGVAGLDRA